jgi:MoaA/NifB/PqqE/SkfB family radical SAM enzyme
MGVVRFASDLGIRVNIFTSGDLLNKETVDELRLLGVSVSLKWNSFCASVQDRLVGSPEYTQRRGQAFGLLRQHGFNQPDAAGVSCLAFVNSIMPGVNDGEIVEFYRYCRENGIVPDIDTLLPFGRASQMSADEIAVIDRVAGELRWLDSGLGIEWPGEFLTYVGSLCDRCHHHLYVDCFGRVSPCLGANKRGAHIGNVKTGSLSTAWRSPLMHNIRARRYTGRCSVCVKFLDGRCNSCLGRFASAIGPHVVETTGCWKFERA